MGRRDGAAFGRAFFAQHPNETLGRLAMNLWLRLTRTTEETGNRRTKLSVYIRFINDATYPAPKPLSMFTTLTLEAHEFIIPSKAATPLNAAP